MAGRWDAHEALMLPRGDGEVGVFCGVRGRGQKPVLDIRKVIMKRGQTQSSLGVCRRCMGMKVADAEQCW